MGQLGGRPRKFGAEREADGTVVRRAWARGVGEVSLSVWQSLKDTVKAQVDPRENTVAGCLEIRREEDIKEGIKPPGGITKFERLAGERFAQVVTAWRRRIASSPNPNAPAANLQGGTGSSASGDPFDVSDAEQDRITISRLRYEGLKKAIRHEGMDKPTRKVIERGRHVWDAIEAIFILNDKTILDEEGVTVVREDIVQLARHGLKPLIFHFGLTSDDDEPYRT